VCSSSTTHFHQDSDHTQGRLTNTMGQDVQHSIFGISMVTIVSHEGIPLISLKHLSSYLSESMYSRTTSLECVANTLKKFESPQVFKMPSSFAAIYPELLHIIPLFCFLFHGVFVYSKVIVIFELQLFYYQSQKRQMPPE